MSEKKWVIYEKYVDGKIHSVFIEDTKRKVFSKAFNKEYKSFSEAGGFKEFVGQFTLPYGFYCKELSLEDIQKQFPQYK